LDAERLSARRARRAEAQDGPSKVACGAFGETLHICRRQKAWFLPAGQCRAPAALLAEFVAVPSYAAGKKRGFCPRGKLPPRAGAAL